MINCTTERKMLHKNEKFMVSLVNLEKVLDDDSKKLLPKSGGDCFLKLKLKDVQQIVNIDEHTLLVYIYNQDGYFYLKIMD